MKKTIYILAIMGLLFGACDKIEEPYLVETDGSGPVPGEKVRKVLLEEFTGHICVNCPEATKLANDLKLVFGEQLVLLSIHAGDLAIPSGTPYTADYRTPTGTGMFNYYQPMGVPMGMVNRSPYQGSTVLFKDSWEPAIQDLIDIPPDAFIEIETVYNDGTRKLDIHVHTEFLKDLDRTYNLSVFIMESGIVSAQKNDEASIGPSPDWFDYEHNHMLRKSLNGTWGDFLADQPASGTIMSKDYSITLDAEWEAGQCGVIAIALDSETYEILQVEEVHVQ
ncbi:MAG: Omp28-related outer membrane protein [Bacteroidetes bacterium]|nr:Omp28-related outer membrane protein [Bacteroidota bacterium]MCK5766591.1 Omp28-related outer membrane protein [Bacteroidales bacterium]